MFLDLLKDLYFRLLKPSAVKSKDPVSVDYQNKENQKALNDLVIGQTVDIVVKLSDEQKETFYKNVLNFHIACDYIINRFPINDEALKHAEVADISKLESRI